MRRGEVVEFRRCTLTTREGWPGRGWRSGRARQWSDKRPVLSSLPGADLAEVSEPVLDRLHHGPRPGARRADDQHRAGGDRIGADRIGQAGDVAALVVFEVEVGRKIDVDHL